MKTRSKTKWLSKNCSECTRKIYYLRGWSNIPEKCQPCQLDEIYDLSSFLKKHLLSQKSNKNTFFTEKELSDIRKKKLILHKITSYLACEKNEKKNIYSLCKEDIEILKYVLSLYKSTKSSRPSRGRKSPIIPKQISGFVSGGAPS